MPHPHPPHPRPPRPQLLASLRQALEKSRAERPAGPHAGPAGGRPVVVLGVGSVLRSDDAVGIRVAEGVAALIKERGLDGLHAIDGGPAPENTTAQIRQISPSLVIIVDAAAIGGPPGTIRVVDPAAVSGSSFGTHGLPLTVLAGYLRAEAGCAVMFVGIQPASVEHGETMSEPVSAAAGELAEALAQCLGPS